MIQENFLLEKYRTEFEQRKKESISIEKIAATCDVSVQTVKNWADPTMGGIPSVTKARKLAELLGELLDAFEKDFIKIKILNP